MFQVHEEERHKRGRRKVAVRSGRWVQVNQIFVLQEWRKCGCGKSMFTSMLKQLKPAEYEDIRLSVVDLNVAATRWYRFHGFVVVNLFREFIGKRDDANIVIYQEMRRFSGSKLELMAVPSLFKSEVIHQVITIDYPDKSGIFEVRIVGFDEKNRFHYVDSRGLSLWEGESFTDVVNLNELYRDGYVSFKTDLSLVHHDLELSKREMRKAEALKKQNLKRQLEARNMQGFKRHFSDVF